MTRRRRRRGPRTDRPESQSSPSSPPSSPNGSPRAPAGAAAAVHIPPAWIEAFTPAVEQATALVKVEIVSRGRIGTMAFFVHTDGAMKAVTLSVRDNLHKEIVIRRIREKAHVEEASAVLVLTEAKDGRIMLSGVAPGMGIAASVDYAFDTKARAITSWQMRWLDRPVTNVFLEGIFEKAGNRT